MPGVPLQVLAMQLQRGQARLWLLRLHRQAARLQQLTNVLHSIIGLGSLATSQGLADPVQAVVEMATQRNWCRVRSCCNCVWATMRTACRL